MSREWPKADERGLARFANKEFAKWVPLEVNWADLVKEPDGRRRLIEAIYADLSGRGIRYTTEDYNQDERKQLIRTPAEILDAPKEGTCLDLSLLFSGVCLGKELLPLLIITDRHAFVAVSLGNGRREVQARSRREWRTFEEGPVTDIQVVRDLVAEGGYLAVECTGFAKSTVLLDEASIPEGRGRGEGAPEGLMSFERALAAGEEQLAEADSIRFVLDLAVAHDVWAIEPHRVGEDATLLVETVRETAEQTVVDLREAGREDAASVIGAVEGATESLRSEVKESQAVVKEAVEDITVELGGKMEEVAERFLADMADQANGTRIDRTDEDAESAAVALPAPVEPLLALPDRDLVGRSTEIERLLQAGPKRRITGYFGDNGMGKTALFQHIAWEQSPDDFPDGEVYVRVGDTPPEDVLQQIYEAFYEPGGKLPDQEIGRRLADKQAVIMLDDVKLAGDDVQWLRNHARDSWFVVAASSRDPMSAGRPIPVPPLGIDNAVALFADEYGPLTPEEAAAARAICEGLDGHPARIIQAAQTAQDVGLGEVAGATAAAESPADATATTVTLTLTDDEREVLEIITESADAPVPRKLLARLVDGDVDEILRSLEEKGVIGSHSPRFTLTGTLAGDLRERWDTSAWMGEMLSDLAAWVETEASPDDVLADTEYVLRVLEWGVEAERWEEVLRVVRAIDTHFARGIRWGTWERVLQWALRAALALEDLPAEAWARHQLGTRLVLEGRRDAGRVLLLEALELREGLVDLPGIEVTEHNLGILVGAPPPERPPARVLLPPPPVTEAPDRSLVRLLAIGLAIAVATVIPALLAVPAPWATPHVEFVAPEFPPVEVDGPPVVLPGELRSNRDEPVDLVIPQLEAPFCLAALPGCEGAPAEESVGLGAVPGVPLAAGLAQAGLPTCEPTRTDDAIHLTLEPGQRCLLDVVFDPTEAGSFVRPLRVERTDDGVEWEFTVSGRTSDAVPPSGVGRVSFASPGATVAEDAGSVAIVLVLTVADGDALAEELTLTVTGSPDDGDYAISGSPHTFAAGTGDTTHAISVEVIDDADSEPEETATLTIDVTGGGTPGDDSTFILTITDNDGTTTTTSTPTTITTDTTTTTTTDTTTTTSTTTTSTTTTTIPPPPVTFEFASPTSLGIEGDRHEVQVVVRLASGATPTGPLTVGVTDLGTGTAGGADYQLRTSTLTFEARDGARASVIIDIARDDLDERSSETIDLALPNRSDVHRVTIVDPPPAPGPVTITPDRLVFAGPGDQSVTVGNGGRVAVTGFRPSISLAATPFSVVDNSCTGSLAPGGVCTITVRFSPPRTGSWDQQRLRLQHSAGFNSIPLQGTSGGAVLDVSNEALSFGGGPATRAVTLTNVGTLPITAISVRVSPGGTGYTVDTAGCDSALPLEPGLGGGESCTIQVNAGPNAANAELIVASNGGGDVRVLLLAQ